jgi:hypothetical protein
MIGALLAASACRSSAKPASTEIASDAQATPPAESSAAPAPVASAPGANDPPAARPPPPPPLWELPSTWRGASDLAFERALDAWLPPGSAHRLSADDLATLTSVLDAADRSAVRAAVLLARTRDPHAGDALLARLEKRASVPGATGEDAVDVVAACAFAEGTPGTNAAARLAELAAGKRPHPDLCARVECARSALALGRDGGIPFLLQVLRTATTAGKPLGPDDSPADLAFAQARAAEALATRAGTDVRFRPEASVKDRVAEAARLEKLLPAAPSKKK